MKPNPNCQKCGKEQHIVRNKNGGYFWCYNCEIKGLLIKNINHNHVKEQLQAENLRLRIALNDIMFHSVEPFSGLHWMKHIHDVAKEALKK